VPDVLICADTIRWAEMRHEVPATVIDPFLYLEHDGIRHVVVSSTEVPLIEEVGEYVIHLPEKFGLDELRRTSSSWDEMFVEIAVRAVRTLGVERAIVPDTFPLSVADRLRAAGVELTPDGEAFADRRRAKSTAELAGIRRAQAAAEAGMAAARDLLAAGAPDGDGILLAGGMPVTSERLRTAVAAMFVAHGAAADEFITSHGTQTAIGHHLGEGPIRAGEPVVIDLWPRDVRSSCFTDMTRTFVAGEPPAEVAEWHRLCVEWLHVALAEIRPGVTGRAVYDAVADRVEAAGFTTQRSKQDGELLDDGMIYSLGHGVGLEVHEAPTLGLLGHAQLVAGDVLAVEPDLSRAGAYGVRVEDLVLVTDDGCEQLTSFPYDLVV
jgi:Xaa-Pro aminopeptidase